MSKLRLKNSTFNDPQTENEEMEAESTNDNFLLLRTQQASSDEDAGSSEE